MIERQREQERVAREKKPRPPKRRPRKPGLILPSDAG